MRGRGTGGALRADAFLLLSPRSSRQEVGFLPALALREEKEARSKRFAQQSDPFIDRDRTRVGGFGNACHVHAKSRIDRSWWYQRHAFGSADLRETRDEGRRGDFGHSVRRRSWSICSLENGRVFS